MEVAFPEQRWGPLQTSLYLEQHVEVASQRASMEDRRQIHFSSLLSIIERFLTDLVQ